MKLSRRLETVARLVLPGLPAADIGADHALLATYLVKNGISPRVIVGELHDGPYQRAYRYVAQQGLNTLIEVRQGNGLEVLAPAEVASIIIAGLGGTNIAEIIMNSLARAYTYRRFILQPMFPYYPLRKVLAELGWAITQEEIINESGNFYTVIVAEPRRFPAYQLTDLELELGPLILAQAHQSEVREFLAGEIARYERVIAGLERSDLPVVRPKLAAYRTKKKQLEEILNGHHYG